MRIPQCRRLQIKLQTRPVCISESTPLFSSSGALTWCLLFWGSFLQAEQNNSFIVVGLHRDHCATCTLMFGFYPERKILQKSKESISLSFSRALEQHSRNCCVLTDMTGAKWIKIIRDGGVNSPQTAGLQLLPHAETPGQLDVPPKRRRECRLCSELEFSVFSETLRWLPWKVFAAGRRGKGQKDEFLSVNSKIFKTFTSCPSKLLFCKSINVSTEPPQAHLTWKPANKLFKQMEEQVYGKKVAFIKCVFHSNHMFFFTDEHVLLFMVIKLQPYHSNPYLLTLWHRNSSSLQWWCVPLMKGLYFCPLELIVFLGWKVFKSLTHFWRDFPTFF